MIHSTYAYTYISRSRHFVLFLHLTVHIDFSEKYKILNEGMVRWLRRQWLCYPNLIISVQISEPKGRETNS